MFSHDEIWLAIDKLASSVGYSTSGLAKKAGLDPTSFNRSKRMSPEGKPRWPSTESLAKILAVTDVTMDEFMTYIHTDLGVAVNAPRKTSIPVIGCAQAGSDGYFTDAGYPQGQGWDEVDLPGFVPRDETTYALEVSGDSMQPLYRDGDILVVEPETTIRRGDRVIVKTKDGQVMAKELARQAQDKICLKSLHPDYPDLIFQTVEIDWIARILWVSQ